MGIDLDTTDLLLTNIPAQQNKPMINTDVFGSLKKSEMEIVTSQLPKIGEQPKPQPQPQIGDIIKKFGEANLEDEIDEEQDIIQQIPKSEEKKQVGVEAIWEIEQAWEEAKNSDNKKSAAVQQKQKSA